MLLDKDRWLVHLAFGPGLSDWNACDTRCDLLTLGEPPQPPRLSAATPDRNRAGLS